MTLAICARDAAATIERAVASCLSDGVCPILLVDDHCRDDTVARARRVAGERLRVVTVPSPGGVAAGRQAGLDAIETEFAAWLDADDEWRPGRAQRLLSALQSGHDIATEAIDLHDGAGGAWLRRLEIPAFVRRRGGAVRLFERNFLSGDTQVAFRVATYRAAGGYDAAVHGVESFDLLLRALRAGARLSCGDEPGYRMYAYPASVSRDLARQRQSLALALRKHDFEDVRQLYLSAGFSGRIAAWALVSLALFRGEHEAALGFLDEASPADAAADEVLEPDGPWPFAEGWRRAFQRGTLLLLLGGRDAAAAVELRRAESLRTTAEGANNLGVALARMGRREAAREFFGAALVRFPGYADATVNSGAETPAAITTHPLRRSASRSEYPAGSQTTKSVEPVTVGASGVGYESSAFPLPPPELQYHVFSRTVSDWEFLEAGRLCAESLEAALQRIGRTTGAFGSALDFGCGCARVLRHFAPLFGRVKFHGSDVAEAPILWDRANIPGVKFYLNGAEPPLALADASIDYLWSISVFSHLNETMALAWLGELRRVLRPGGIALVTVHGHFRFEEDRARGCMNAEQLAGFEKRGFTYARVYSDAMLPDWYQNAYMTESYARETYGRFFEVLDYLPRGMMGRQDIVVMRGRAACT